MLDQKWEAMHTAAKQVQNNREISDYFASSYLTKMN